MSFSSSQIAFNPTCNTIAITANNPAPTGVQALPKNPNVFFSAFTGAASAAYVTPGQVL